MWSLVPPSIDAFLDPLRHTVHQLNQHARWYSLPLLLQLPHEFIMYTSTQCERTTVAACLAEPPLTHWHGMTIYPGLLNIHLYMYVNMTFPQL